MKVVQGTARADRMSVNEPEPPGGEIVKPGYVKYRAAELWAEYAPLLTEMGTLSVVDVPNFGAWCVLMARFEAATGNVQAADVTQLRMLGASLGMDASARAKLGGSGNKKRAKDPAEKYFKAI
jgi:phage terminase small subunit